MEKIKCSAIKIGEKVYSGHRHHNIIKDVSMNVPGYRDENGKILKPVSGIQGFLTESDKFVTRKEAKIIAVAAKQCIMSHHKTDLFSEDLY